MSSPAPGSRTGGVHASAVHPTRSATPDAPRRVISFAHSSAGATVRADRLAVPVPIDRAWAWGDATGRGVRVCVIDSGVDTEHPMVGTDIRTLTVVPVEAEAEPEAEHAPDHGPDRDRPQSGEQWAVVKDDQGDVAGHGTACAGIIRSLAPDCAVVSVRILGNRLRGRGEVLLRALEWAVEERFDLVNVSLSTRREAFKERLHDLADEAYFAGVTLVSAAHNSPVTSYPWRFPSVISVGSHAVADPLRLESNPDPPVDFFALGVQVPAAWPGGGVRRVSGNSFAAPHVVGMCARILERHPGFRTPQLRHVLAAVADNID